MVLYPFLLVYWLSIWYTTLSYKPTGYLYDTQKSSTGPLDISMVHYYLLLAHWIYQGTLPSPFGPLISQRYTTPSYWPTGYHYGSLLSSTSPLDISMVHYYLLLAHWIYQGTLPSPFGPLISQRYTTPSYWPTGYHYGTPLSSSGPLGISMVPYPHLLADLLSL